MKVGIIGGGLMGREVASAFGRWFALTDLPVKAELIAVCDTDDKRREWFRNVPTVRHFFADYRELLDLKEVDVVYVAVPHHLHEQIYLDVLAAGKDMLAEKPFGIDLAAATRIEAAIGKRFVRVSSEFPFFPGAQRVIRAFQSGAYGRLLEVRAGFLHSSDLDPNKPANWKRQSATCGEIGVMGDLGLHVTHIPLRLGLAPTSVFAQLQKGFTERPGGKCDTWDNAILTTTVQDDVPMRLEMKRMAPGETDTWYIEFYGTEGAARFSTKEPKTLWTWGLCTTEVAGTPTQPSPFTRLAPEKMGELSFLSSGGWTRTDLGHESVLPTITGGIFEFGFPDCILQMWGAFALEREGLLENRFSCATPAETVASHRLFDAALQSEKEQTVAPL